MAIDTLQREDQRSKDTAVNIGRVREQFRALSLRQTRFVEAPKGDRNFECYLTRFDEEKEKTGQTIGPYARWLVAANLLTADIEPSAKIHAAINLDNRSNEGQAKVRRVFGTRKTDDFLRLPMRYRASTINAEQQAERDAAHVHLAILRRLNEKFGAKRGCTITLDDFLGVHVPLVQGSATVGFEPLRWFEKWLEWGVGTPLTHRVRSKPDDHKSAPPAALRPGWHKLLARLIAGCNHAASPASDSLAHQRVTNVYSSLGLPYLTDFATQIGIALSDAAEPGRPQDAYAASTPAAVPVVYVSLHHGATRPQVLKQIYTAFSLDASRLDAVLAGERALDLAADLEPVRKALTVSRVVMIFDGWDNVEGPFEVLHEYLCNTHWGEVIRILAQPHFPTVLAAQGQLRPCYQLLVLSTGPAAEIGAWATPIRLTDIWARRNSLVELDPQAQAWVSEVSKDGRIPGVAEATLLRGLSRASLQEWARKFPPPWTQDETAHATQWRSQVELMRTWIASAKLNPVEAVAIRLVAAAVNGIRRQTLERCLAEWGALFAPEIFADWLAREHAASQQEQKHLRSRSRKISNPLDLLIKTLVTRKCKHVLIEINDEEIERLSPQQRELELNRKPRISPAEEGKRENPPATSIGFASKALRGLFVAAWLEDDEAAAAPAGTTENVQARRSAPGGGEKATWAHLNFLLAEESIRQASSQFRHLTAESPTTAYSLRRAVQGLYHGLASLGVTTRDFHDGEPITGGLYGPALPVDAQKRFRYLYNFLYRNVIEGNAWRLGRSFGRSDLRLDLLSLFLVPQNAARMLAGYAGSLPCPLLPTYPLDAAENDPVPAELKVDLLLWCDLLVALAQAGRDLGGGRGQDAVDWALQRLPGGADAPAVNAKLPRRGPAYYSLATSALKVRVDWYQSRGTEGALAEAERLCWQQLGRLGVARKIIDPDLYDSSDRILAKVRSNEDVKLDVLSAFGRVQKAIEAATASAAARLDAADILFRLGEILATRADDQALDDGADAAGVGDSAKTVPAPRIADAFARSFAVYWVADRVRSGAGALRDMGTTWPNASARAMRYYVRVTLKLARLLGQEHPQEDSIAYETTTHLLERAQSRIGVYTRHHFQFRRERDSMLLLEASWLRAWVLVNLERESHRLQTAKARHTARTKAPAQGMTSTAERKQREEREKHALDEYDGARIRFVAELPAQRRLLRACWNLIEEAEVLLFSLGFQTAHVRRLLLERVKTAIAFVRLGQAERAVRVDADGPSRDEFEREIESYLVLARTSLDTLAGACGGHVFWDKILQRQEARLREAHRAWTRDPHQVRS